MQSDNCNLIKEVQEGIETRNELVLKITKLQDELSTQRNEDADENSCPICYESVSLVEFITA